MSQLPHEPPRITDAPTVAERIGPDPEDFRVDEIPLYPATGEGDHYMVELRKRCWTTPDAVHAVARAAGVAERDVGHAGMKDRHAVTTQWLTVPVKKAPPDAWELPEGLEILSFTRHGSKLRTGHLAGNRFTIRLVGAAPDGLARASATFAVVREKGLPNYFGAQRFGRGGENLPAALRWLAEGAPPRGKQTRFQRKLYPSVVQAEVFNRYLTLRQAQGLDQLFAGDVVRLAGSRSVFCVEEPSVELPRLAARDIFLTGPMPGPKMRAAAGVPHELERRVQAELGLTPAQEDTLAHWAEGTRRDLVVYPDPLAITSVAGDLVVEVGLPAGAYATQLLRELIPTPWLERGT